MGGVYINIFNGFFILWDHLLIFKNSLKSDTDRQKAFKTFHCLPKSHLTCIQTKMYIKRSLLISKNGFI